MRLLVGFGRSEKGKIVESGEKLAIERQRLRAKANHTTPHQNHTEPSQAKSSYRHNDGKTKLEK